ncbi:MAG: polysaccharide biosynthesis protein [Flavobacteriales bacterium]
MKLPSGNTPRWIIFIIDLSLVLFCYLVAYLIRFDFNIPQSEVALGKTFLPLFIIMRVLFFYLFRSYSGIIRYTSTQDTRRIFFSLASATAVLIVVNIGWKYITASHLFLVPNSILAIEFLLSLVALVLFRFSVKQLYAEFKNPQKVRMKVAIIGAGESGLITKKTIDQDPSAKMEIVAFFDDDRSKVGKQLDGVKIYSPRRLNEILEAKEAEQIIISIQNLNPEKKKELAEKALLSNTSILNVPPVKKWIKGELSLKQLQSIRIEDLLGRSPIKLNNEQIRQEIQDKNILVTGGAGSIGSELVRQILSLSPKKLWVFDQAESPMYDLQQELKGHKNEHLLEFAIGDVSQKERVRHLISRCNAQLIFHAAAYKHVPLMEENPSEAILTNVAGTKHLADEAVAAGVEKFVLISTDKAVNPTNVMGATKRTAEIYCEAMNQKGTTKFIATRFGNVLGSNGSVIPLFRKQIKEGGPLTVTHREVTRFFMTIPESVELVLEASAMGKGGEVFVFDMGESIKIYDLAKKMIQLSGLKEGRDIELKITGLRPGEKLYEELLASEENTIETHHPKIMIAKLRDQNHEESRRAISGLITLFQHQENDELVAKLKQIVPEFKSQNSEFSKLDTP